MNRPLFSRYSVRLRITFVVALLTAISLVGVGFTLYTFQLESLDRAINTEQRSEIAEFRELQRSGIDPRTGEPFEDANRLLRSFLEGNLPSPNEYLYGFPTSGSPLFQGTDKGDFDQDPKFRATIERMRESGGAAEITVDGQDFRLLSQPIHDANGDALFVVVHNLTKARDEVYRLMQTYSLVALTSWIVITCIASLMAGRLLSPVRRLSETAQAISGGDLSSRIDVTGNDDLTDLQRTFNDMLDRVENAFSTQRQLLDDVGHELRTPLTIVRGHLELLDTKDPNETALTRTLALDETDRMSGLVDDLLMLAKVRRPDFVTFRHENLHPLTTDLLNKARALGQRAWILDKAPDAQVELDRSRITQAMMQLVENAIRHTSNGDVIAIGSKISGTTVEFWVRDSGVGVAEIDRERIFARFHRGVNETKSDEGFGLGLSIVSAIAAAHGGACRLDQTTSGATFRLVLPTEQKRGTPNE